jgi:hypothetical protein
MNLSSELRQETRDGILWYVSTEQRFCYVRIQGSDESIIAHFPSNFEATPSWLKLGNSVKVVHTGGVRGRIEVIGHGQTIPTPLLGDTLPTMATSVDTILTGCYVRECFNQQRMAVLVETGTYRILGMNHILGAILMLNGEDYKMGDGGLMGTIAGAIGIDAPPAPGYWRYDAIDIGADGIIDYNKGTYGLIPVVEPLETYLPHIRLATVLVYGGMDRVSQPDINRIWKSPVLSEAEATIADSDLDWDDDPVFTTITVRALDQYRNPILSAGYGWYMSVEFLGGNGTLSSPEEGSSSTKIGGHTGSSSSSYVFTYTRDKFATDISPAFRIVVEVDKVIETYAAITLRDADGDPM